jgi:hypothetical protein
MTRIAISEGRFARSVRYPLFVKNTLILQKRQVRKDRVRSMFITLFGHVASMQEKRYI